jgi:hypothetical protein
MPYADRSSEDDGEADRCYSEGSKQGVEVCLPRNGGTSERTDSEDEVEDCDDAVAVADDNGDY